MSYQKHNFISKQTLTAKAMNEIEDGIVSIEQNLAKLNTSIPEYVVAEAESVIDRVLAAQGNMTFTLAAITDLHYGNNNDMSGVQHACQALKYIDERINLDAVAVLGDYTDGYPTTNLTDAINDYKSINALLDCLRFAPNLRQQGNHDYYLDNIPITRRFIQAYSNDVIYGSSLGGYFYKDFSNYKLRIICPNTNENNPWEDSNSRPASTLSMSDEQIQWLIESLDLSSKADADDWSILILSHQSLDYYTTGGDYRLGYIIDAYKNGDKWSNGSISCDFTGKNMATLIGNIHGHIHNLLTSYMFKGSPNNGNYSKVFRMCVPNACYGRENQYTGIWGESETYTKTKLSAKDTSFIIFCIDLLTHKINAICYGAGYDRELDYINGITNISYGISYNLTNAISSNTLSSVQGGDSFYTKITTEDTLTSLTVTMGGIDITASVCVNGEINIPEVSGNIVITAVAEKPPEITNLLDTVGYTNGIRFSASNGIEKTAEGCFATGYIDVSIIKNNSGTYKDHLSAYGAEFNNANAEGKCVWVGYDADKNILGQGYLQNNAHLQNMLVTFDTENKLFLEANGDITCKYIRLSGYGRGEDAVVLINTY